MRTDDEVADAVIEILEAMNEQLPWKSETEKNELGLKIKMLDPNYEEPTEDETTEPITETTDDVSPEVVTQSESTLGEATGAGSLATEPETEPHEAAWQTEESVNPTPPVTDSQSSEGSLEGE